MMLEAITRAPVLAVISQTGKQWRVAFYRRFDGRTWSLFAFEGAWSEVANELEAIATHPHTSAL